VENKFQEMFDADSIYSKFAIHVENIAHNTNASSSAGIL
jgi:hypothetical protein